MATLADLARQYLNQALPDISGIFTLPQASMPIVEEVEETVAAPELTPEQLRLLYPQDQGGRDDDFRGGGKFGNLDLSRSKTFTKDVYDEELGDFIPTELTAYYNPTLGNYQTFEGKNINPMFSNTGLTFGFGGGILDMLGLKPKTVGGYVPGSIRGIYDTPMNLFRRERNEPPGLTPQQKMGLASMSKVYQDIGRTRDRGSDTGVVNVQAAKDAIERSRRESAIAQEVANREAARNRGSDRDSAPSAPSRAQNEARTSSRVSGGRTRAYGL